MFLFGVKCGSDQHWRPNSLNCNFLQPVLGGHAVLSGHLAIPRGWPLNTGSTVTPTFIVDTTRRVFLGDGETILGKL